jgi:hypothetical protein
MFFGPDLYSPGTHECECVSGIEPASTVSPSCTTPGQYQWYIRAAPEPAQPEASLTRKRRQEAVVRRAAEQDTTLCPSTLTPCRIKGSDDGWEVRRLSLRNLDVLRSRLLTPLLSSLRQCIDTQTELESCGGCRHGVLSATLDSAASIPFGQKSLSVGRRCVPLGVPVDEPSLRALSFCPAPLQRPRATLASGRFDGPCRRRARSVYLHRPILLRRD